MEDEKQKLHIAIYVKEWANLDCTVTKNCATSPNLGKSF